MSKIKLRGHKLIRYFDTNNPHTIKLVETALKAREHGGYVVFKGKPISVTALHYSRVRGVVQVRVEYEPAIRPPTN